MEMFLYNLLNSEWFWFFLVTWVFLGVAWGAKRIALLDRIKKLISKPVIFIYDDEPANVPFYPRSFLEVVANGFRNTLTKPFSSIIKVFTEFIKSQHPMVFNEKRPMRTFACVFFLACILLFAYADAVAIANGLSTLGLLFEELPSFFLRYDIAVGVATFLSVIVGFLILSQILSKESEFTHWDEVEGTWKNIAKLIAVAIVIIGITVALLLGVSRMIALGYIEANNTIEFIVQLGINVFILINGLLSASLVFSDGLRGVIVIFIAIQWVISWIFYILDYLATILGTVFPFLVDIFWRIIFIAIDITLYIVFIPFLGIINIIMFPFKWIASTTAAEK